MKTWATSSDARADLYIDEGIGGPVGICDQFRAMRIVMRSVPKEMVNDVLEALGLRKRCR